MYRHSPSTRTDAPRATAFKDAHVIPQMVRELHDAIIADAIEANLSATDLDYVLAEFSTASIRIANLAARYGSTVFHVPAFQSALADCQAALDLIRSYFSERSP